MKTRRQNTTKLYEAAKDSADRFNECWPIGTWVKYYPVQGQPEFVESKTRSEAWAIPSGAAIVQIVGKSGGVSLEHIEVLSGQETKPIKP